MLFVPFMASYVFKDMSTHIAKTISLGVFNLMCSNAYNFYFLTAKFGSERMPNLVKFMHYKSALFSNTANL